MTFSMVYAYTENFVLPLSHDEVVHGKGSLLGKMPGDEWRRFAGLRSLLAYQWAHPGKQLLFMGSEFGQGSEWSDTRGLDWWVLDFDVHQGAQRLSRDLNLAYRQAPALWQLDASPDGFRWIDANDAQGNVLSFLRFPASPASASPAASAVPPLPLPPPFPPPPPRPVTRAGRRGSSRASPTSPRSRTWTTRSACPRRAAGVR